MQNTNKVYFQKIFSSSSFFLLNLKGLFINHNCKRYGSYFVYNCCKWMRFSGGLVRNSANFSVTLLTTEMSVCYKVIFNNRSPPPESGNRDPLRRTTFLLPTEYLNDEGNDWGPPHSAFFESTLFCFLKHCLQVVTEKNAKHLLLLLTRIFCIHKKN